MGPYGELLELAREVNERPWEANADQAKRLAELVRRCEDEGFIPDYDGD